MNMDVNRGTNTSNFYGSGTTGGAGDTSTSRTQDMERLLQTMDENNLSLDQLLDAANLLANHKKLDTDGLPPPPQELDTTKALAGLGGLSDSQVSADIYAFMALFQKLAQQMRDTARTQRTSEMQAQVSALQDAASKMKEAAGQRFTAAIAQGAAQIVGGLLQAGMSGMSLRSAYKGAQMEAQGKNNLATIKEFESSIPTKQGAALTRSANDMLKDGQLASSRAQLYQGLGQSLNSMATGSGTVGAAFNTIEADKLDAAKMDKETEAKVAETGVQHANDMMQQMMDIIRDVREKLQSIQQAAVETNRGIARNI